MTPSEQTSDLLEVLLWPRVGPARARGYVAATATGRSILDTATELGPVPSADARERARRECADIVARCEQHRIALVGLSDAAYPALLAMVTDPPPILYVRGEVDILSHPAVAVVGTRSASTAGARNARTISRFLVKRGFVVVSGLAIGIDTQSHLGALDEGGATVAILAHGLDIVAPASNRPLADRILTGGGALVSEHPPGTPPRRHEFVRRNRIQSGLSLASIVVESDIKGGAMHQANFTRSQGRRLMTVLAASDETRDDLNEAGARQLLASAGAIPLRGTGDLARELERLPPPRRARPSDATPMLF